MSVLPLRQRLVIEAFDCTGLNDIDRAYDFLVAVANKIEVQLYSQPIVMKTPNYGLTGVAIFLESGAILHTWEECGFLDFFLESCKEFDDKKIYPLILEFFNAQETKQIINHKII